MRIVALDPGGTTGYSYIDLDRDSPEFPEVYGGQLGPQEHHIQLLMLLNKLKPTILVCESFEYRVVEIEEGTVSPKIELISNEYIGIAKLWKGTRIGADNCEQLVFQKPSEAVGKLTFWSNDKLKRMGVYNKGERHRNDATRHLLHFAVTKLGHKHVLRRLR